MKFSLTLGTSLPLIISSDNLCFFIDTGSTHNTLFSFVYEHFTVSYTHLRAHET